MRETILPILFFSLITTSTLALASQPPKPLSKKQQLNSVERDLKTQTQKKDALEQAVKALQKDLRTTQEKLIDLSASIQSNEAKLGRLQNDIQDKESEKRAIQSDLQKDHKYIGRLVLALQRIQRTPMEALMLKPEAPLKTAQSAMLMGDILPLINKDATALREKITRLNELTHALNTEKDQALKTAKSLSKEHTKLSALIEKRQGLYKRTSQSLSAQKAHVSKIAKQVNSLNDLVQRLEQEKEMRAKAAKAAKPQTKPTKNTLLAGVTRAIPGTNSSQTPVSGYIKTRYNQADDLGAKSQGIEITAQNGALVVAPMDGEIMFAGPFNKYKNLIIIELKNIIEVSFLI